MGNINATIIEKIAIITPGTVPKIQKETTKL